jgi:hypothetical protein
MGLIEPNADAVRQSANESCARSVRDGRRDGSGAEQYCNRLLKHKTKEKEFAALLLADSLLWLAIGLLSFRSQLRGHRPIVEACMDLQTSLCWNLAPGTTELGAERLEAWGSIPTGSLCRTTSATVTFCLFCRLGFGLGSRTVLRRPEKSVKRHVVTSANATISQTKPNRITSTSASHLFVAIHDK